MFLQTCYVCTCIFFVGTLACNFRDNDVTNPRLENNIVLVTSVYKAHSAIRQRNLNTILKSNCDNAYITQIHLLCDPEFDASILQNVCEFPACQKKVFLHHVTHDPSKDRYNLQRKSYLYSEFLEFINVELAGSLVLLSNSDILFDESLEYAVPHYFDSNPLIFCLSRYNYHCPNTECHHDFCLPSLCIKSHGKSFDSFIFRSPVPKSLVLEANHPQDIIGAENRLMALFSKHNYTVVNPCKSIITMHKHCVRDENAYLNGFNILDRPIFQALPISLVSKEWLDLLQHILSKS